jgi:adenylate cyclase
MKKHLLFVLSVFVTTALFGQEGKYSLADSIKVNALLDSSKRYINTQPDSALAIANEARELSREINFPKGEALALKNIGFVYYYRNKFVQTLEYWNQSLQILQAIGDDLGQANLQGNIGAVFYRQGDEVGALKHHLESLRLAEKTGNQLRIFFALNNIAGIYFEKKATRDKALDYLLKAYPIAEKVGDTSSLALVLGNIGQIYLDKGDDKKALEYYTKCLRASALKDAAYAYNGMGGVYLKEGNIDRAFAFHSKAYNLSLELNETHLVPSLQGLAATFVAKKDYRQAINYYKKAEMVAVSQESSWSTKGDLYDQLASTYAAIGNYSKAFQYQQQLGIVKDTMFSETVQKKLNSLQFEFDLQKKEGEISLLTKDKALQEGEIKQQRLVKNAFAIGLVLIFIILFILYRDNRVKVRINKILDSQKVQIEHLLLNILPVEVAQELQATGNATPKSYENVSVLFTDFKGFTTIADSLSPEDLVLELNKCFIAFDTIIEKYGLEKIKTIGDSYMCAGGLPTPGGNHHYNIVKAAMEIQSYIFDNNEKRKSLGLPLWEIRIGINNGPVVAGVVGSKKYAYDIWGSTVNIASRMESSGVPGQVNISAAAYEKIKDKFVCIYRGKIHAKNVGEVDMYLVDHEVEEFEMSRSSHLESTSRIIPG